jgi:hypothetical protein
VANAHPDRPMTFISGGSTVGLRLANILMGWGMSPHLTGFDSAYSPHSKTLYAYDKPEQTTEFCDATIVSQKTGRQLRFTANQHMVRQAMAFEGLMRRLPETTVDGKPGAQEVVVHGDGPIPWMAWLDGGDLMRHANPEAMQAKYGDAEYWDYQNDCASDEPFAGQNPTFDLLTDFMVPACVSITSTYGKRA